MNKFPESCRLVRAQAVDDDTVALVLKSGCRHYSLVTVRVKNDGLFVTDVRNRCGLRECAKKIIKR